MDALGVLLQKDTFRVKHHPGKCNSSRKNGLVTCGCTFSGPSLARQFTIQQAFVNCKPNRPQHGTNHQLLDNTNLTPDVYTSVVMAAKRNALTSVCAPIPKLSSLFSFANSAFHEQAHSLAAPKLGLGAGAPLGPVRTPSTGSLLDSDSDDDDAMTGAVLGQPHLAGQFRKAGSPAGSPLATLPRNAGKSGEAGAGAPAMLSRQLTGKSDAQCQPAWEAGHVHAEHGYPAHLLTGLAAPPPAISRQWTDHTELAAEPAAGPVAALVHPDHGYPAVHPGHGYPQAVLSSPPAIATHAIPVAPLPRVVRQLTDNEAMLPCQDDAAGAMPPPPARVARQLTDYTADSNNAPVVAAQPVHLAHGYPPHVLMGPPPIQSAGTTSPHADASVPVLRRQRT